MTETISSPIMLSGSASSHRSNSFSRSPFMSLSPPPTQGSYTANIVQIPAPSTTPGKPSPFAAKAAADDGSRKTSGIGGPVKRRESLSGIGANLRNARVAGMGRAVSKGAAPDNQKPSGLSNLLRRASTRKSSAAATTTIPSASTSMQRRGSTSSSAGRHVDATTKHAGASVAATSSRYTAENPPKPTRHNSISVRVNRPDDASNRLSISTSPPPFAGESSSRSPSAIPPMSRHRSASQAQSSFSSSPLNIRMVRQGDDSAGARISPLSPPASSSNAGMTVGSPNTGKIWDVVGSPTNPTVVFAPINKNSGIGGVAGGKKKMQAQGAGIGGASGKDWMSDRPSGIGASVSHGSLPKSNLTQALKSLVIDRKRGRSNTGNSASVSPNPAGNTSPGDN
ncbi:hypothetical protein FBU59_003611 [Linderina macrospora]|uniref:Uncharacterized protein n=1 Tax=Linderina macrospora TaxID=4868 RepID=A0ACC1J7Z0_9FUNG|nr:hypothetical protein FBU59_003611 [Linderina macrospora]